eukprot:189666-Rhodomonas_salina.2
MIPVRTHVSSYCSEYGRMSMLVPVLAQAPMRLRVGDTGIGPLATSLPICWYSNLPPTPKGAVVCAVSGTVKLYGLPSVRVWCYQAIVIPRPPAQLYRSPTPLPAPYAHPRTDLCYRPTMPSTDLAYAISFPLRAPYASPSTDPRSWPTRLT